MTSTIDRRSIERNDECNTVASPRAMVLRYSLLVLLGAFVVASIHFDAPPRFDETGYLILARSLADGRGYREIDKPAAPVHSHFPPGWPATLATCWTFTSDSIDARTVVAHAVVVVLWFSAVVLWSRWFASPFPEVVAIPLSVALAANWLWIRLAGELRSETLFIMLSAIVLLAIPSAPERVSGRRAAGIGGIVGLAILTRHIGVALAGAVLIEFVLRRYWRAAIQVILISAVIVLPWAVTQWVVGHGTQAELLLAKSDRNDSYTNLIGSQLVFYVRRLPDSLFGPFVETATVFRDDPLAATLSTALAAVFASVWSIGLVRMIRNESARPAGLYLACSLVILVVWPFTEAGRFLIPLVPLNLAALVLGLDRIGFSISRLNLKLRYVVRSVPVSIALASLPFGLYTGLKAWRTDPAQADAPFEAACRWIAGNLPADAVVASRHPGDVYWRSSRVGVPWPEAKSAEAAASLLSDAGAGFLFVDQGRYVGEKDPAWLADEATGQVAATFRQLAEPATGMRIYEIVEAGDRAR
ncbi:hypothetical protein GC170_20705 [bacterium]|nr:hypothetical protein [bacterium]